MVNKKTVESIADEVSSQNIKVSLSTDGYAFFTFTKEILEELIAKAQKSGKFILAIKLPNVLH